MDIIIIDEVPQLHAWYIEGLNMILKDISGSDRPFGGNAIILSGDFKQTLPVIRGAHQLSQLEVCIKSSDIWNLFKNHQYFFNQNLRLVQLQNTDEHADVNLYQKLLDDIGKGLLPYNEEGYISLPEELVTSGFEDEEDLQNAVIDYVYGNINEHIDSTEYLMQNAIICPHNEDVNKINEKIVKEMNRTEWIAYSADTPCEENKEVAVEFLNTLNMSGFPMHELRLKKVCL